MNGTEGVKPTVPKTQSQEWNGGNKTHGPMNGTEGVKPTGHPFRGQIYLQKVRPSLP